MGNDNEIALYEMFYDYLKENGYTPDQDSDIYWNDLEEMLTMIYQQVIDDYEEE